ncbi:unnamed protein product [Closterium sp. NIES-54]
MPSRAPGRDCRGALSRPAAAHLRNLRRACCMLPLALPRPTVRPAAPCYRTPAHLLATCCALPCLTAAPAACPHPHLPPPPSLPLLRAAALAAGI